MIDAKCYKVFIASPEDVLAERQIVKEVVYQLNTIIANSFHVVLLPIGWEDAIPGMGKPPQAIINGQLLENADLLIGIFYSRIGSKTEKAISGTVEEIQTHIKNKKPAMIYFSEKPLPQNFDREQFYQLSEFKEWVKSTGLYGTFKDEVEFRDKVFKNLLSFIKSDLAFIYDIKRKTQHIFLSSMENKTKLYAGIMIGWCLSICAFLRENPTVEKINKEKVAEIIESHQRTLQLMLEVDGLILDYNEKFMDLINKIVFHYRFKDELKYNAFLFRDGRPSSIYNF